LELDASFTASPTPRGKVPSLLVISADPSATQEQKQHWNKKKKITHK